MQGGTEAWGKGLGLHWDGARPKHAADTTLRVQVSSLGWA